MARVYNLGTMAHEYAVKQMASQENQNAPQEHKIYLERRYTHNYLANTKHMATVATVALVALGIITGLKFVFLLLAGAAYFVRQAAQRHIDATPVTPGINMPSEYFEPNNPIRASQLRQYLGLANTLAPVNQPAANQPAANQPAANQPAENQPAAATSLWTPDAFAIFGSKLWSNKVSVRDPVVPAPRPYSRGFDPHSEAVQFVNVTSSLLPGEDRLQLLQGLRAQYGYRPLEGYEPPEIAEPYPAPAPAAQPAPANNSQSQASSSSASSSSSSSSHRRQESDGSYPFSSPSYTSSRA